MHTWSMQVAASEHGDGEQSLIFVSQFCPVNPKLFLKGLSLL